MSVRRRQRLRPERAAAAVPRRSAARRPPQPLAARAPALAANELNFSAILPPYFIVTSIQSLLYVILSSLLVNIIV
ncbi:unnamed protein product [Colias eurytheme]|nr:unnamed protein product [Colias eurytheme]